ncbi:MAG: hypothetical protein NTW29_02345 [Bacteroidetes bacterium]|nr:hypothetical protein [Bacteroidota bacterium]
MGLFIHNSIVGRVVTIFFILLVALLSGCNTIGMLLFYKGSKTETVYRSAPDKKNYYIVKATTISHCGCTELSVVNHKHGVIDFRIDYMDNVARKTVYRINEATKQKDTIRLRTTTDNNYMVAFTALDKEIFQRIDTILQQKPKGIIYPVRKQIYMGYNFESNY